MRHNEIWLTPVGQHPSYNESVRISPTFYPDQGMYALTVQQSGLLPIFRSCQVPEALCRQVVEALGKGEDAQREAARAVLAHMGHLELAESNGACKGAHWTGKTVADLLALCGITE